MRGISKKTNSGASMSPPNASATARLRARANCSSPGARWQPAPTPCGYRQTSSYDRTQLQTRVTQNAQPRRDALRGRNHLRFLNGASEFTARTDCLELRHYGTSASTAPLRGLTLPSRSTCPHAIEIMPPRRHSHITEGWGQQRFGGQTFTRCVALFTTEDDVARQVSLWANVPH